MKSRLQADFEQTAESLRKMSPAMIITTFCAIVSIGFSVYMGFKDRFDVMIVFMGIFFILFGLIFTLGLPKGDKVALWVRRGTFLFGGLIIGSGAVIIGLGVEYFLLHGVPLILATVFGSVGFVLFSYGKKLKAKRRRCSEELKAFLVDKDGEKQWEYSFCGEYYPASALLNDSVDETERIIHINPENPPEFCDRETDDDIGVFTVTGGVFLCVGVLAAILEVLLFFLL